MSDYCLYPNQCGLGMDCSPCYQKRIAKLESHLAFSNHETKVEHAISEALRADLAATHQRLAECEADAGQVTEETSDGYHTFRELYEFRKMYNAALFNEWAAAGKYSVHKSWRHHDGEPCFGGGWFIVVAMLPSGQITNHYKDGDWSLFQIPEHDTALFEYDGHTGLDTLVRLRAAIDSARGGE